MGTGNTGLKKSPGRFNSGFLQESDKCEKHIRPLPPCEWLLGLLEICQCRLLGLQGSANASSLASIEFKSSQWHDTAVPTFTSQPLAPNLVTLGSPSFGPNRATFDTPGNEFRARNGTARPTPPTAVPTRCVPAFREDPVKTPGLRPNPRLRPFGLVWRAQSKPRGCRVT